MSDQLSFARGILRTTYLLNGVKFYLVVSNFGSYVSLAMIACVHRGVIQNSLRKMKHRVQSIGAHAGVSYCGSRSVPLPSRPCQFRVVCGYMAWPGSGSVLVGDKVARCVSFPGEV